MSKDCMIAYGWFLMYRAAGYSDADALVMGIEEVAPTWYAYARIFRELKAYV